MQRVLIQIATAGVLLAALFVAYAEFATRHGKAKAEALCSTIHVGAEAKMAEALIAGADTDPRLRFAGGEQIGAGFHGAFMDRWFCNVIVSDGKVRGVEIRLLD